MKAPLRSFTDSVSQCRGILAQLPGTLPVQLYWTQYHQTSMKHFEGEGALRAELAQLRAAREEAENTLNQENELIEMKSAEKEYIKGELERQRGAIETRKKENGLRMWETTTRVTMCYQLSQALVLLRDYHSTLMSQRLKPRIEARNQAFDLLQTVLGNIRVFCRLRPVKEDRIDASISKNILTIKSPQRQNVTGTGFASNSHKFDFFHIFGERDSQKMVFHEIKHLIMAAMHYCNVTLFAYGQTGSGKTFTMEGGARDDRRQDGIRPRAMRLIMKTIQEWKQAGIDLECSYAFMEIYNEQVRDLLDKAKVKDIRENKDGLFFVEHLIYHPIDPNRDVEEIVQEIDQFAALRTSGATKANLMSSRSHSSFQFKFGYPDGRRNFLSLIDLAGSERLAKTSAVGKRASEAKAINLSLSALNDTLTALGSAADGQSAGHIPYRQSKLTQILKEPLCGTNSKVAMFVNIGTAKDDINESINSLRFATKVQGVRLKKERG